MSHNDERGWKRLLILLSETTLDQRQAAMIAVGIDPDTVFPANEGVSLNLILLPEAVPPIWGKLSPEKIESRLLTLLAEVEADLSGLPSPMTPYAFFSELLRERFAPILGSNCDTDPGRGRRGFVPPWLRAARRKTGLKNLLPPDPVQGRAAAEAQLRPLMAEKKRVHRLWLEWRFGEVSYGSRAQFSRDARINADAENASGKDILDWIDLWEREHRVRYGKYIGRFGTTYNGYGHSAFKTQDRKRREQNRLRDKIR